jgi:hypothetical protein
MKLSRCLAVSVMCVLTTVVAASAQTLQQPSRPEDRVGDREEAEAKRSTSGGGAHSSAVPEIIPQTSVTFSVPLNLSQLAPEISRVGINCEVRSSAIIGVASVSAITRVTPVDGHVHTTASVVVPIPRLDNPIGKTGTYVCRLWAGRTPPVNSQTTEPATGAEPPINWALFSAGATDSALRMVPDPPALTGSFVWAAPPTAVAPANVTTTSPGGNP